VGARGFEPLASSASRILEVLVRGLRWGSRHVLEPCDSVGTGGHVTHSVTQSRTAGQVRGAAYHAAVDWPTVAVTKQGRERMLSVFDLRVPVSRDAAQMLVAELEAVRRSARA
jgi:hypothetical protein